MREQATDRVQWCMTDVTGAEIMPQAEVKALVKKVTDTIEAEVPRCQDAGKDKDNSGNVVQRRRQTERQTDTEKMA